MRKLFVLVIIISNISFAQTQDSVMVKQTPEIELPDFVITGTTKINLPTQSKEAPAVYPILTDEFIVPKIGTEKLEVEGLTDPTKLQVKIADSVESYNFHLNSGIGLISNLKARGFASLSTRNASTFTSIDYEKVKDYEINAGRQKVNLKGGITYILPKSQYAPAKFELTADYSILRFAPYKAIIDNYFRTSSSFSLCGDFNNILWREFHINLGGLINTHNLNALSSHYYEIAPFAYAETELEKFNLQLGIKPLILKSSSQFEKSDLVVSASGEIEFKKIGDRFNFSSGINYQSDYEQGKNFIGPFASLDVSISENFILGIFYNNKINLVSPLILWNQNPYLDTSAYGYSFERITNKFGLYSLYYFSRESNIEANASFYKIRNKNVFVESDKFGYLTIMNADVNVIEFSVNSNLDLMRFGRLIGELTYKSSKMDNSNIKEPFQPTLSCKLQYLFKFDFSLLFRGIFLYNSSRNVNKIGSEKLGANINLGFSVEYEFIRNMIIGIEGSNILNRSNYEWVNYKEKPLDLNLFVNLKF